MARPSRADNVKPYTEQIEEAFLRMLQHRTISEIHVSDIVREVNCTRATFYYHYANVENLAESIFYEHLPRNIINLARSFLRGETEKFEIDRDTAESIYLINGLLNKDSTAHLTKRFKEILKETWTEQLNIDTEKAGPEFQYLLDFLAGGITEVLTVYGRSSTETISRALETLIHAVREPFVSYIQKEFPKKKEGAPKTGA